MSGEVSDSGDRVAPAQSTAPEFRIWPPVAVGVPWAVGAIVQALADVPFGFGRPAVIVGWVLVALFVVWNGWCLVLFARRGTGLLPGQETSTLLREGPYRVSRNPLYLGLLVVYAGAGLVVGSWMVLALIPLAWAGLRWGAIAPEERYLHGRLGAAYDDYCRRVPRWLGVPHSAADRR